MNRTLSDLFPLPAASCCTEPGSGYGALGLPAADLERLRSFAILPEDSFLLLYSVSTGYLLETGLSDSAISTMLCALAKDSGLPGAALQSTPAANVPDDSLYAGLPSDLLDPLVVPDFPFPELLDTANGATGTVPWSAVAKITERTVVRRLGLSVTALRAIRYLWQLQERALSIADSAAAGMPTAAYCDFGKLLDRYLQLAIAKVYGCTPQPKQVDLCLRLLRGRLRLLDSGKVPLRKLGMEFGISGERVRQVESKLLAHLKHPATLQHLDYLWHLLDRLMVSGGGGRCARELCLSLQQMHGWSTPPSEEALATVMEFSPRYRVVWDAPIRVALTSPCCVDCGVSTPAVFRAVKTAAEGTLSFGAALETMLNVCDKERCPELRKVVSFSMSLFHFMADSTPEFIVHEESLRLGDPNSLVREILEEIVLSAVDGMHFKEVSRRFNLAVPGKAISAHNIHARLSSASWAALWGHGFFKHRELLYVPVPLITEIQEDLAARLESDDIPYLCVNGGVFDQYAQRLQSNGVPNPPALYSCMKIIGSPTLAFGEYPYVLRKDGAEAKRSPIYMELEKFISLRTRAVPAKELMTFVHHRLGVPAIQVPGHFMLIPNILRIGHLRLHLSNVPAVADQLRKIVDDQPKRQSGAGTSKERLFRMHQAACKALGITGPGQLASLVDHFFPGRIDWQHMDKRGYEPGKTPEETKPGVGPEGKPGGERDAGKNASGAAARPLRPSWQTQAMLVLSYLHEQAKPCKTKEIFELFPGSPKQYFYKVSLGNKEKVLWYTNASVIARRSLAWNDVKQGVIEALARRHLQQRAEGGKPYGSCSEICRDLAGQLPELASHLHWTPVLLHGLLVSSSDFIALGRQKNLFVARDSPHGIATLDDFLFHALQTD